MLTLHATMLDLDSHSHTMLIDSGFPIRHVRLSILGYLARHFEPRPTVDSSLTRPGFLVRLFSPLDDGPKAGFPASQDCALQLILALYLASC